MAPPSSFLQQSGQALTGGTRCLRFALLQDLLQDLRVGVKRNQKDGGRRQIRHQQRYYGSLLAVGSGYDPSQPDSLYNAMSADCTLGRIAFWARTGFHPEVYDSLIGDPDNLQPQIDEITATLAAYDGKQISKTDTLQTFVGLAYHMGVAAVAERSDTPREAFTSAELDQFIQRNLVRSTPFDVLQVGSPSAAATLVGALVEVLDYMYIAMHGDVAFLLGCWVKSFDMDSFTLDKGELEVFHPVEEPAFAVAPSFQGLPAAFPTPPQFPSGIIGRQPTLELQSTVYRRWEELARGPEARRAVEREKQKIDIGKWLDDKPSASPPDWPLPVFDPPPADDAERERRSVGLNANGSLHERLDWLRKLLAGSNKASTGKRKELLSYIAYRDADGVTVERKARLNGGAYPRGGRKPPSVTHDTTYGLDLDLDVQNVKQRSVAAGRSELADIKEALEFDDVALGTSFATTFTTPGKSLFDTDDFLPAVAFTQAILTTLPSRLIFGDPLVLIGAFGPLMDRLKAGVSDPADLPELFTNPQHFLYFDPAVHYNHWHVDWVPQAALDKLKAIDDSWVFVPSQPKAWNVSDDFVAFDNKKRDFWRPVPIRYKDPRACGTLDDILSVNDLLGTGIDLADETSTPAVSPFPMGNVRDLPTLVGWLDQYFPHWRPPS